MKCTQQIPSLEIVGVLDVIYSAALRTVVALLNFRNPAANMGDPHFPVVLSVVGGEVSCKEQRDSDNNKIEIVR